MSARRESEGAEGRRREEHDDIGSEAATNRTKGLSLATYMLGCGSRDRDFSVVDMSVAHNLQEQRLVAIIQPSASSSYRLRAVVSQHHIEPSSQQAENWKLVQNMGEQRKEVSKKKSTKEISSQRQGLSETKSRIKTQLCVCLDIRRLLLHVQHPSAE
jgi:hypothetical protein